MLRPSLTNFSEFVEPPKPVIRKSPFEKQQEFKFYLNLLVLSIIGGGCVLLYLRYKYKAHREQETKAKLLQFDSYINDYIISDMIQNQPTEKQLYP